MDGGRWPLRAVPSLVSRGDVDDVEDLFLSADPAAPRRRRGGGVSSIATVGGAGDVGAKNGGGRTSEPGAVRSSGRCGGAVAASTTVALDRWAGVDLGSATELLGRRGELPRSLGSNVGQQRLQERAPQSVSERRFAVLRVLARLCKQRSLDLLRIVYLGWRGFESSRQGLHSQDAEKLLHVMAKPSRCNTIVILLFKHWYGLLRYRQRQSCIVSERLRQRALHADDLLTTFAIVVLRSWHALLPERHDWTYVKRTSTSEKSSGCANAVSQRSADSSKKAAKVVLHFTRWSELVDRRDRERSIKTAAVDLLYNCHKAVLAQACLARWSASASDGLAVQVHAMRERLERVDAECCNLRVKEEKLRIELVRWQKEADDMRLKCSIAEKELLRRSADEFTRLREVQLELAQLQAEVGTSAGAHLQMDPSLLSPVAQVTTGKAVDPVVEAKTLTQRPFTSLVTAARTWLRLYLFAWRARTNSHKLMQSLEVEYVSSGQAICSARVMAAWRLATFHERSLSVASRFVGARRISHWGCFLRAVLRAWWRVPACDPTRSSRMLTPMLSRGAVPTNSVSHADHVTCSGLVSDTLLVHFDPSRGSSPTDSNVPSLSTYTPLSTSVRTMLGTCTTLQPESGTPHDVAEDPSSLVPCPLSTQSGERQEVTLKSFTTAQGSRFAIHAPQAEGPLAYGKDTLVSQSCQQPGVHSGCSPAVTPPQVSRLQLTPLQAVHPRTSDAIAFGGGGVISGAPPASVDPAGPLRVIRSSTSPSPCSGAVATSTPPVPQQGLSAVAPYVSAQPSTPRLSQPRAVIGRGHSPSVGGAATMPSRDAAAMASETFVSSAAATTSVAERPGIVRSHSGPMLLAAASSGLSPRITSSPRTPTPPVRVLQPSAQTVQPLSAQVLRPMRYDTSPRQVSPARGCAVTPRAAFLGLGEGLGGLIARPGFRT